MGSFLHTLLFFIVALAILIAFHEFGHFWVARRLGVKVVRFSIGFGKPLWKYQKDPASTEYLVAAIPLGGYVKMVDEREGEVAPEDLPYAFNRQSLTARSAIVLAGPLFNLFLAVFIFWGILVNGETGFRPLLGKIEPGTIAAQAGFETGDEILEVDGDATPTWNHAISEVFSKAVDLEDIDVKVRSESGSVATKILRIPEPVAMDPASLQDALGFRPWEPELPPRIDSIKENSPAAAAGLEAGDLVVKADGVEVSNWTQWVEIIRGNPGKRIQTVVERNGMELTLELIPAVVQAEDGEIGQIGATVRIPEELIDHLKVEYRLGVLPALGASIVKVTEFSLLTFKMMGKMLLGKASIENLSGPISIAKYASESATMGLSYFLKFIAIVSISLGVLNLLPIPVLDGGHLLFFLIEAIKGRPLSEHAQLIGQQVGILLLICLMGLAFFLDIERLFR
ncbi:MAG: RIP metalloprotease RseP [Methylococcaceae bacterium]|nr:RIP metalloprotease RseP [Methylococcaceae bacterium]MCI0732301.1 RIP metalloprotease RseP [Methylococcaceae bacterium]